MHKRAAQHLTDETSIQNGHLTAHLNEDHNQDAYAYAHVQEGYHFNKRSANPQLTIGSEAQKNLNTAHIDENFVQYKDVQAVGH